MNTSKHRTRNQRIAATAAVAGLIILGLAVAGTARAEGADTPRVDQRQAKQEQRIQQGVESGALTKREAHGLAHQQLHIAAAEQRAKADGTVTNKEKARLHAMQDKAGHQIARQKHDGQTRP